jgi:hypothetical protein
MSKFPEKPSAEEAAKELIGVGYCQLSDTHKKVIAGKVAALAQVEETAQAAVRISENKKPGN